MGGLNSIAGLNKVGVDYRPDVGPSAEAGGGKKVGGIGDDDNIIRLNGEIIDTGARDVAPGKGTGRSVLQQLDVLLLHAAKRSVMEDAVQKAQTVGQALRAGKFLSSRKVARIESLAQAAAGKLKALDRYTGASIARALAKDAQTGRLGWRESGENTLNDAARAVKDALDAHKALSSELYNLNKQLAAGGKAGDALLDQLTELQFQCERRETEINSVVLRMYELAQKAVVNRQRTDPEIRALLDAKFLDLMPREALHMHGTADAMELMQKSLGEQMRSVAEKLDAFAADNGKTLTPREITDLQTSLATMRNAVENVRLNGIALDGGRRIDVDKSLVREMETVLGDVAEKLASAKTACVRNIRDKFIPEARDSLLMTSSVPTQKRRPGSKFDQYAGLVEEFLKALDAHGKGDLPEKKLDEETKRLSLAAWNLKMDKPSLNQCGFDDDQADALIKVSTGFRLVAAQYKEMLWTARRFLKRQDDPLTAGDVRRLLLGEIGVSSVVEAAARGFEARDADPEADDANIADSRPLGAGKAGNTYLLTTKTGAELVFKPDLEGRLGLDRLAAGGSSYRPEQNTANLNLATYDTAKAFHCEDLVVKYSVGSHKGQFGTFMEKAKGVPGHTYAKKAAFGKGTDTVSSKDLPKAVATDQERNKLEGQLARKLNRLQWLDIITGQGDRHNNHYFLRIDPTTHDVDLKGIDNDASFPSIRIGVQKYKLPKPKAQAFEATLQEVCTSLYGRGHARSEAARCHLSEAIEAGPDGTLTIDMAKVGDVHEIGIALTRVVGAQSIAFPDAIDEEFYNELVKYDNAPEELEAFIATIAPRLSVEAIDATRQRIQDAVRYAKDLRDAGKKYTAADWEDPQKRAALTDYRDTLEIHGANNRRVDVQYSTADNNTQGYLIAICPSYYKRDALDTLFAPPPEKP